MGWRWRLWVGSLGPAPFFVPRPCKPGLELHLWVGNGIVGLVLVRILWGFVGTHYARFSGFPPNLTEATGQLAEIATGRKRIHRGHTPLGALMIYNLPRAMVAGYKELPVDWRSDPMTHLPPAKTNTYLVLIILIVVQAFCAVFFVGDVIADFRESGPGAAVHVHLVIEAIASLSLVAALCSNRHSCPPVASKHTNAAMACARSTSRACPSDVFGNRSL